MKKSFKPSKPSSSSSFLRYAMLAALVVLLAFSFVYVYNISKSMYETEKFVNSEESSVKYSVIFIYSNSCGYCTKFKPVFESTMLKLGYPNGKVSLKKYESSDPLASRFASMMQGVPFTVITKNDTVLVSKSGFMEEEAFTAWLKMNIK